MKYEIFDLHEQFCQEALIIKNYSPKTILWYKSSLQRFLRFYKNELVSIDEITTERLRKFLYHYRTEGNWTADTFLHYYKAIRSFLTWCVKRGYIANNPIIPIEKPKLRKKLPKGIKKDDAMKILEFSFNMPYSYHFERYRNRAIIATFLYCGLRSQELLDLKYGDIDSLNGVLVVNKGKGGKDRILPICSRLRFYLSEYIKERKRLNKESIHFFTSLKGDNPFTYSGLKRLIKRLRDKTGIDFSAHRLRHTFATLMLEGGCDLFSLQKMMGHSDIKTTTIYLSTTVEHLQEQISKHPLGI